MNMKYQKKPVVIEAIEYNGANAEEVIKFTNGTAVNNIFSKQITIPTLEGELNANIGDWIIKGIKGEFYPCKPDIFDMTYIKV